MFAVPLLLQQSVVGVLYLNGKNARELTETERSLLGTLSGQAALAIQRTRLHEQIMDSDALYRSLIDHIPQFVLRKDKNLRVTWPNASFCKSVGMSLPEILGKGDLDFYPRMIAQKYRSNDRQVMKTKRTLLFDEEHRPPSGRAMIAVRVVKTPVLDAKGRVTGVQAIFWESRKRWKAEDWLQISVKARFRVNLARKWGSRFL